MNKMVLGMKLRTWLVAVAFSTMAILVTMGMLPHGPAIGAAVDRPAATGQAANYAKTASTTGQAADYAKALSKAFRETAKQVRPAVVMIRTESGTSTRSSNDDAMSDDSDASPFGDLFRQNPDLKRFFGDSMPSAPRGKSMPRRHVSGVGSGVIIDPSGVILTNNHVVDGAGKVVVRLHDGREFEGIDIRRDPRTDVAVLHIKADRLVAARLGDSDKMDVGDWVLALGDPFGLEGTVTAGIISAKERGLGIAARESFLQTDAAINPGNSGGPLVNLDGEVIGLNTAISSHSGGYQGVGFAVPTNLAKWVADQLLKSGHVQRAYLGVMIQPVTQELADRFGVPSPEGALVTEAQSNTPAAKAGVRAGDVIVEFNGKPVASPQALQGLVEQSTIGAKQTVVVIRDKKRVTLEMKAEEQPANYGIASRGGKRHEEGVPEGSRLERLGIDVADLTPELGQQFHLRQQEGVVITRIEDGSVAQQAGLTRGMVISQVNRKPVQSVSQLREALEGSSLSKGLLLLVHDRQGAKFILLKAND